MRLSHLDGWVSQWALPEMFAGVREMGAQDGWYSTALDVEEARAEKNSIMEVEEMEAWDDVSGVKLDAKKVLEARREEMGWFKKKGVYRKIPRQEALKRGWKIVKVRWIDINKGDDHNPIF